MLTRRVFVGCGALAVWSGGTRRTFAQTGARLAAIDWGMYETAVSIGVSPVAVAERIRLAHVSAVAVPGSVADLGLRGAPNLEALSLVAPDLVLSSNYYVFITPQLERIAPVFARDLFIAGEPALPRTLAALEALAVQLGLEQAGQEARARIEAELDGLAHRAAPFADRTVCLLSVGDARHVQMFGADSLYGGVLTRLGLKNGWSEGTRFAFTAPVPLARLAEFPEARIVVCGAVPVPIRRALAGSVLWNSLPAVREGRVDLLPDDNPFGGAPSALRLARHIVAALEAA
jgi:ferric hydroxamate transport system substrate-binding protein